MTELPRAAAWRHLKARDGFEVVFPVRFEGGYSFLGVTTAVEAGLAWGVRYVIELDASWSTRSAEVTSWSSDGTHAVRLQRDGSGRWLVDGAPAPQLDGLHDVDLEASAFTNAFPARRLDLVLGAESGAPAAYVRQPDLRVERLEQRYRRLESAGGQARYEYSAPAFGFEAVLAYDRYGLVVDYPGIAVRVA